MARQRGYRDKHVLEEMYCQDKMSQKEIADEFGVDQTTISEWMQRHGIETRDRSLATSLAFDPLSITYQSGYEQFRTRCNYETQAVSHHRLLAVAEYGIDAVKGKVVHHKNGIKWDNRPDNIELMTDSGHKRHHALNR